MSGSEGKRQVSREHDRYGPSAMALLVASIALLCIASNAAPALLLALPVVPIGLWHWWTKPRFGWGDVRVESDSMVYTLRGVQRRVPLAHVAFAWRGVGLSVVPDMRGVDARTLPPNGAMAVVVQLHDRSCLRFSVRDETEANALLRALGKDPANHRVAFRGRRLLHSVLFWVFGPTASFYVTGLTLWMLRFDHVTEAPTATLLIFTAAMFAVRYLVVPRLDIEIGNNGVLDRARLRGRFLPWSAVSSVERLDWALVLVLHDGSRRSLWCNPDDSTLCPAVFDRAREALAAWQRAASSADPLTALDRNGRTIAQWRADLATLVGGTGYRAQVIDRARLEAIVADPATPLERRVGAALALAHHDPVAPTRVRVVAEGNADPAERRLLLCLAEGTVDDDVLDAALRAR